MVPAMRAAMKRFVHEGACWCNRPGEGFPPCPCGGEEYAHRLRARAAASDRQLCMYCNAVSVPTFEQVCLDCAMRFEAQLHSNPTPAPMEPLFQCVWCEQRARGGRWCGRNFLCSMCVASWEGTLPEPGGVSAVCSFCEESGALGGFVMGPSVVLCGRCFDHAMHLRSIDQRDTPPGGNLQCSFDGKSLRELAEVFVVGERVFCDECTGLMGELFPVQQAIERYGIALAPLGYKCRTCGVARPSMRVAGSAKGRRFVFCEYCVEASQKIGVWCARCNVGLHAIDPGVWVGSALWCSMCVRSLIHGVLLRCRGV